MKNNLSKLLLISAISPLFMASLCENQYNEGILVQNPTKIQIPKMQSYKIGDTLWITGKVSSKFLNDATNDSIADFDAVVKDYISVSRLVPSDGNSNAIGAVDEFDLSATEGSIEFEGACPDSEFISRGILAEDRSYYNYEVALVPKRVGDYVLSWLGAVDLGNSFSNVNIFDNYTIDGSPNTLGIKSCRTITTTSFNIESNSFIFFTVN